MAKTTTNASQMRSEKFKAEFIKFIKKYAVWFIIIIGYMIIAQIVTGTTCLIKSTIGVPCPGCGMTRATLELLSGNISAALHYHPLVVFFYPAVIVLFLLWKFCRKSHPRAVMMFAMFFVVVFITVYVIRLIIYFPHTEPFTFNTNTFLGRFIKLFIN